MSEKNRTTFHTAAEVAGVMRLSRATVHRLMRDQEILAVRFGGSYRISEVAVAEYIARVGFNHGDGLEVSDLS